MYFGGHGNAGMVSTSGGMAGAFVEDYELSWRRVVIWAACHTALDGVPGGWGNIMQQTVTQGATACAAYTGLLSFDGSPTGLERTWAYNLSEAMCVGRRDPDDDHLIPGALGLEAALAYAAQRVNNEGGYGTYAVVGSNGYLVPPAR